MTSIVEKDYNFASLSVHDLLEARDLYHFHLMSKENVVGTAIGLYLIRKQEAWPKAKGEGRTPANKLEFPRTLANSEVRDYSWPCILAFVHTWETPEDFNGRPSQALPKTLYLPDGKAVPVCVVQVDEVTAEADRMMAPVVWPHNKLGGGLPITVAVQGRRHMATAGCLVTDGNLTYALTARHACGEPYTGVQSQTRDGLVDIGLSSEKQLTRLPFSEVYPAFPSRQSFLTLDVGLVRLDDVNDWTSNVYGLPPLKPVADFYEQNLSLKLVDRPVVAWGAASGLLRGRIKALFYRYRSVGGYDYVGDFLIAPRSDGPGVRHGDSGAIWHLDLTPAKEDEAGKPILERDLRPLAVEWGGQVFDLDGKRSNFAVATSLSNICRLLDVEMVTDQERGVSGYWGRVGHYSIATLSIGALPDGRLKTLMDDNADLLSFDLQTITRKGFAKNEGKAAFARLADVPDDVWKKSIREEGGRDPQVRAGPEHPTHYADIDLPYGPEGQTLRELILADPDAYLTIAEWQRYYRKLEKDARDDDDAEAARKAADPFHQGLLPFRVWQIFDEMVGFARSGDTARFVTAAGILAHYVGDASQPLHGSHLADGDPDHIVHDEDGTEAHYGEGVHGAFESDMLDIMGAAGKLVPAIDKALPPGGHGLDLVGDGRAAALALVRLMDAVADILPPMDIIDVYEEVGARGTSRQATRVAMWDRLGDRTGEVIALGVRYLAMIWQSAWVAGNGDGVAQAAIRAFDADDLRRIYIERDFLPSLTLADLAPVLGQPTDDGDEEDKPPTGKKKGGRKKH